MLGLWESEFQVDVHLFHLCALALNAYIIYFRNTIIILNIMLSSRYKKYNYCGRFSLLKFDSKLLNIFFYKK